MRPIVLLGTGTDVGKTYVCAQLARELHRVAPATPVLALKPIESGMPPSTPAAATLPPESDAARLAAVSTLPAPTPNPLYSLREPLSPHLAARRAGTQIDLASIPTWAKSALPYNTLLLVETAGGALSPLTDTLTNLDLATAFEPSVWVLVAPDSLGVLHDVTATLTALRALARQPDHLVLTAARSPDRSTGTNAAELPRIGMPRPFVVTRNDTAALAPLAALLHRDATA